MHTSICSRAQATEEKKQDVYGIFSSELLFIVCYRNISVLITFTIFSRLKWKQIFSALSKLPYTIFPSFRRHPSPLFRCKCKKKNTVNRIESMKFFSSFSISFFVLRLLYIFILRLRYFIRFASVINNLWVFIY